MAKKSIFFRHDETKELHKLLSAVSARGHNLSHVFDDFLTASVCALACGTMEEVYLQVAARYSEGKKGQRGIDRIAEAFGCLVAGMEKTGSDLLGDLFEGAITFGENGQFFTPECVCEAMAKLTDDGSGETVHDPACGSGRTLLASARVNPARKFFGTDIDHRCVKMTTLNLALNGLRGRVTWGNALSLEEFGYYAVCEMGIPGLVRWCERKVPAWGGDKSKEAVKPQSAKPKQVGLFDAA